MSSIIAVEYDGPASGGLVEWDPMDPKELDSPIPVQRGHLYDEDTGLGYLAGVWDCTAFDAIAAPYPVDEYMLILAGEIIMEMPDGTDISVKAGEAFILPQGLQSKWKMPGYVKKVFMILERPEVEGSDNPSLSRVTLPPIGPLTDAPAVGLAVERSETCFVNADGRMSVTRRDYPNEFAGPVALSGRRLVTVLKGMVSFGPNNSEQFSKGTSYYVPKSCTEHCHIAKGTRLIEACFNETT